MQIEDQEYRRILKTIARMTGIDELAAYRGWLRLKYPGASQLERLERTIDGKAHDLLVSSQE